MEIPANILSAIAGSVFGAGGLGGVLVWMAKNKETDAETLRAYCVELRTHHAELRAHQQKLEERVDQLEADKVILHRENSILLAEQAIDRAKIDVLETRLNDLVSHAELCQ